MTSPVVRTRQTPTVSASAGGRANNDDAELPSSKRKHVAHGAGNFLRYQELVKAESIATSLLVRDENFPYLRAGKSMQAALMKDGVTLYEITCREHVKKAFDNGCVGLEPQRNEV
jgi:hypothetical protein